MNNKIDVISFEEFERHVEAIRTASDFDNLVYDKSLNLQNGFPVDMNTDYLATDVIDLLTFIFHDEQYHWIEYWFWELNFGKRNDKSLYDDAHRLTVKQPSKDGSSQVEIPLTTVKDLYDFLIAEMVGETND